MEEEKIKKIAELREILEGRVKSLESEIEGMRTLLEFINNLLLEKSFKRAEEIAKPVPPKPAELPPQPAPPKKRVRTVPLKTGAGELLANLNIEDGYMRIVPAEDKTFNVNTPPFAAFLIERILVKMQERDQELVRQGKLKPDKAFSYEVQKDGEVLQEITIRNFAAQREREIRSATRWTLEKMHEKVQSST
ncbi:MAG: hypothetical protein NWF14_00715 [Candidatus Bathyarchaeota archaeon]|nr:hypothetical protein [Candidatus Bathyarchaeota archaeon]